jgi:hypothetical protein
MKAQDDPEERIRQLEQSAAQYGAVELGAEQRGRSATPTTPLPPPAYGAPPAYGTPPPTYGAPQSYGDPYTAPFGVSYPQVKKGAPVGLIFGAIAVFVVVIFGTIGIVVWNVTSTVGSISDDGETGFAGSGGSVDSPPNAEPSIVPAVPGGDVEIATPGGQFSVSGIEEIKMVACNASNVTISGVNNTVTLIGHCLSVTVSGVENQVTVDGADKISASGFDNRIIYHTGDPEIDNFGGSNVVERG